MRANSCSKIERHKNNTGLRHKNLLILYRQWGESKQRAGRYQEIDHPWWDNECSIDGFLKRHEA